MSNKMSTPKAIDRCPNISVRCQGPFVRMYATPKLMTHD